MIYILPEKIVDLSYKFLIDGMKKTEDQFDLSQLSDTDIDTMYQNFYNAYVQAIGSAWTKQEFTNKAWRWTFFGSKEGGVALRKQASGMWKLNASYGTPRQVYDGLQEMVDKIGDEPVWGVMTPEICVMLEKATKRAGDKKFKRAPQLFTKTVMPHISNILGPDVTVNKDGSLTAKTPDGKDITKEFIANKAYYIQMLDNAKNNPDKLPIPKALVKPLIGIIETFVKIW